MTIKIKLPLRYEIDNDTGRDDEGYWEFFVIYDNEDKYIAETKDEEYARYIVACCNAQRT